MAIKRRDLRIDWGYVIGATLFYAMIACWGVGLGCLAIALITGEFNR